MILIVVLLLFCQTGFADEPEEGVSYLYPFAYDTESDTDGDKSDKKSKSELAKKESKNAWHGKLGAADVTVDAENIDLVSQWHAEWERIKNEKTPKKEKKSHSKKDDEKKEDHSPYVKFSMEWGND